MVKEESRNKKRIRRHIRIRTKIFGTEKTPRLSVFRSNRRIEVQIINDMKGITLASVSSKNLNLIGSNMETAKIVGEAIAKICKEKKITRVVFDRSGYIYHGCIKTLADSARNNGLKF